MLSVMKPPFPSLPPHSSPPSSYIIYTHTFGIRCPIISYGQNSVCVCCVCRFVILNMYNMLCVAHVAWSSVHCVYYARGAYVIRIELRLRLVFVLVQFVPFAVKELPTLPVINKRSLLTQAPNLTAHTNVNTCMCVCSCIVLLRLVTISNT